MERRPPSSNGDRKPRSPDGRNGPSNRGPKTGLESGFRKRSNDTQDKPRGGNFSTRDGKEGFRSDDSSKAGPKRNYADKPKRDYSDKPPRDFGDRPKRDFSDKPKRDYGDRPARTGYADSSKSAPKRDFGDRPSHERPSHDRPAPRGNYEDRPKRSYGDKPERGGYSERPKRDYGERPGRERPSYDRPAPRGNYEDRPKRDFGDRPQRSFDDKPKRDFGDRPKRDFGDKPKRDFGDRPKRSFGDKPDRDRPQRGGGYDRDRGPREEKAPRYTGPRINVSVYGIHATQAALLNPERKISAIYATEQDLPDIQGAIDSALEEGITLPDVTLVEKEAFHRALSRDAVHQGVGLDTEPLEETFLQDIIRKAEVRKKSVVIILDQVTDPHNIGAIVRSACAFGADAIVIQNRNAPEMSGLIAKTASGAAEYVPLVYETNLSRAIDELKEAGFFCLALDEKGSNIADAPAYDKTVLVLGAEGPGLRPLIKEHCDLLVKLPTKGKISSLNVSNAAAISLFAITSKA